MQHYFAPLEGITDSIYRKLHHHYYPGIDRYYTPFLSPTIHRGLTRKEQREIPPADSLEYCCVPQILTKNPEDFIWLAEQCHALGYSEVNLNLGCPSGTVTAKGKGSGMLRDLDYLQNFLDKIYSKSCIPISIKTRIGYSAPDEFPQILAVYNKYPIKELIIHPRVRDAFYNGPVHAAMFDFAVRNSRAPLCFNGDILTRNQANAISDSLNVMIGRGLVANPGMLNNDVDSKKLGLFLQELLDCYTREFGNARNAMFRLKEHWHYLKKSFYDCDKLYKQLRKCDDLDVFIKTMQQIINECPYTPLQ